MALLPVALYGLEVPVGEPVQAEAEFPATFRITMAAIDPSADPEPNEKNPLAAPRATLKLIRFAGDDDEEDSEDDEDDEAYMKALMGGSDSEDESEDEEVNGGPSDPAKSKKAQKEAEIKKLLEAMKDQADSDEEMEDAPPSAKAKGKAKATDEDSESDSEDSIGAEVEEFVICTLDPERTYQQPLDITIGEGERVMFQVTGSHTIYLTGNYLVPDDNGHNHSHELGDSDDESEDEDYDLSPSEDELAQLEGEESDDLDDLDNPRITELSDDEEEAPKLIKAEPKEDKKSKKRSAAALEDGESLDDMVSKSIKAEDAETPKLSKKQLKKLKNNKGEAVDVKEEEKKGEKKSPGDKKVQFAKNLEQGPTPSSTATPDKAAANGKPKASGGVRDVQGVKIEDKKPGTGPAAKNGNTVEMRYIGKLTNGGKVFDSNKKGKPFSFKVGKGEVIKGWDIGIQGMQVGGERRIVIPAHLGYGSSGMPGIPKNSSLTFDVKCLNIK